MHLAIIGAGRMGSAFAWHLARAGHDVTVVARGERLERLKRDGGIETVGGVKAAVKTAPGLDPTVEWDGVLVMVLAHQVKPLLPVLSASKARSIVFLFNTVEALQPLRDAVGAGRVDFGFPTGFSMLLDGKLRASFAGPGQNVTVSSAAWAETFRAAKLPSVVEPDMQSFLRTHAAFVIPLMASGVVVHGRGAGITWAESKRYAQATRRGGAVVKKLGDRLVPSAIGVLLKLPLPLLTFLLFFMNKTKVQRELGSFGPGEVRELIDGMQALAPGEVPELLAIRP
ncbi:MAG: NAD(P)-binding domain-containing protein [Myxococcaceae bacterium]|nr:NAD(P)-binding domain-containing protein [Myxococcaceae bacterium]